MTQKRQEIIADLKYVSEILDAHLDAGVVSPRLYDVLAVIDDLVEKARLIRNAEMSYAVSEGRAEGKTEEAMRVAAELYRKTQNADLVRSLFPSLPKEALDKLITPQTPRSFADKLNDKRMEASQTPKKAPRSPER
ncbi:MAG: hypothetical protein LBR85_09130 [Oscillospiraceae bacterium]|nr:hypothetical protein [Oscillospiraceae bacterium]